MKKLLYILIFFPLALFGQNSMTVIEQINQSFDDWNLSIDLNSGWNMFGYGCPSPINVLEGLAYHTESIIILKDNEGNVYMPEFGFNGIGDFAPGFGYQIKLSEDIEGFSLCDWYDNDIPEDSILSLQQENLELSEEVDSLNAELDSITYHLLVIEGCIDENACNYNPQANLSADECLFAQSGFDCYGNESPYYIGQNAFGGKIFYLDSTKTFGIVAATQDVHNGESQYEYSYTIGFQVGCDDVVTEKHIGSGKNNTQILLNANCSTINYGPSAVYAASSFNHAGYNDWFLPSQEELKQLYLKLYLEGNSFPYENDEFGPIYWTSTNTLFNPQYSNFSRSVGWFNSNLNYNTPNVDPYFTLEAFNGPVGCNNLYAGVSPVNTLSVRPIRYFGNIIYGCINPNSINYNQNANVSDGSCIIEDITPPCDGNYLGYYTLNPSECGTSACIGCTDPNSCNYYSGHNFNDQSCIYAEENMDCYGDSIPYIGMNAYGGTVFYIDETSKRGLVAAIEQTIQYEWGEYGLEIDGADFTELGLGYVNSIDIVNTDTITLNSAAQFALDFEKDGYNDWFLPSKNELIELYYQFGQSLNYEFLDVEYWTSSEQDPDHAWYINLSNGDLDYFSKNEFF